MAVLLQLFPAAVKILFFVERQLRQIEEGEPVLKFVEHYSTFFSTCDEFLRELVIVHQTHNLLRVKLRNGEPLR